MRTRSLLFVAAAALMLMGPPLVQEAIAQQAPATARVGILGPGLPPTGSVPHPVITSLGAALADLGYSEGRNLVLEERWQPADKKDWLPEAIADLERANTHVIFAFGAIPARALKAAGTTIPSVFIMVIPTAEFVSSPEKPEGSMTGFTIFDPKLPRLQLEFLKQVMPKAQRVAFLGDEAVGPGPFKPQDRLQAGKVNCVSVGGAAKEVSEAQSRRRCRLVASLPAKFGSRNATADSLWQQGRRDAAWRPLWLSWVVCPA